MITDLFVLMHTWLARLPVRIGSGAPRARALFGWAIRLNVVLALALFPKGARALQGPELGGCSAIVDGSRLSIIGTEAPNTIHVVGSERGIQVTCDGASDTFTGIEEMTMDGGGGDDLVTVDDSNGLLGGLPISVYSQGSADLVLLVVLPLLPLFEVIGITFVGAPGPDVLQIVAGPLADRFEIASGPDPNSLAIEVTDIASGRQVADISGKKLEDLTVQMGEGDDEANISPLSGIITHIFGGAGDDSMWDHQYEFRPGQSTQQDHDFNGGIGVDALKITSGALADRVDIASGTEANSVEVRVTDLATETPLADISGSELEELVVETADGDDQINTDNRNGLLGRIAISIYSQNGQDQFYAWTVDILPYMEQDDLFDLYGGPGIDTIQIIAGLQPEHFDLTGENATSVEIRVTEQDTGNVTGNIRVSEAEFLTVEMGEGDDQANVFQLPGIALNILGQGGDDDITLTEILPEIFPVGLPLLSLLDLGPGEDVLRIRSGARDDRFDVRRGEAEDAVDVQVTDIASGTVTANIVALAVEETLIKMGAGNDILNKVAILPTLLSVFGEDGDDGLSNTKQIGTGPMMEIQDYTEYYGGTGHDKFRYQGTTASEQYQMGGVPDLTIPDPELRVTDMVTGLQLSHVQFLDVEDVTIESGDGDDRVEVNWDAALMSGLTLLRADLGRGNDSFLANLLPVLTEPPTREVQTAQFEVDAGPGNDQAIFSHFAGSWFDVFFTAETGPGADTVNALLEPPPDDGIPGPEGLRQLQFNVVTGRNDDFVGLENQTSGEYFNVFLYADLEGGNDTFEGRGGIHDANILPGRGFDTARVTLNLRPFVGDFERIVILE